MSSADHLDAPSERTASTAGAPAPGALPLHPPAAASAGSTAAGLAHVGALSFLASRATPSGGFVLALAGGAALARAGQRFGARIAYGASLAAMIQTVAYLGPARLNGPLTQALTAPVMGALERRGVGVLGQFAACLIGRLLHNTLATAFFVFVLLGGLDAYAGTYDETLGELAALPEGAEAALAFTALSLVGWAFVASLVQVVLYRRGMRRWPPVTAARPESASEREDLGGQGRFDPRAVAVAATVAFGLLVASTATPLLLGVAAWLAVAWVLSRPDRRAVPAGVALALLLGGGSLAFSLLGGLGLEVALRRGARALLIVLVATWLRDTGGARGRRGPRRARNRGAAGPVRTRAHRRDGIGAPAPAGHGRRRPRLGRGGVRAISGKRRPAALSTAAEARRRGARDGRGRARACAGARLSRAADRPRVMAL